VLTTAGHVTQIVLLALFLLLIGRPRRRADRDVVDAAGRGRPFAVALALLAAVALLGHLEYFTKKHLNTHEFLHYFLNTRYFAETGYSGLYEAIVVADWEDDRPSYDPSSEPPAIEMDTSALRRCPSNRFASSSRPPPLSVIVDRSEPMPSTWKRPRTVPAYRGSVIHEISSASPK